MKNEETLKQDMVSNITLLGDRILIQLDEIKEHTKTEAGLYIPHSELMETDGGKVTTRPSKQKYYAQGTILSMGSVAKEKLAPDNVGVGDNVLISKQVLTSDTFHFYTDRSKQVQDFKGLIWIPNTLIEAKIN